MKHTWLTTVAAGALLAMAGVASAQTSGSGSGATSPGGAGSPGMSRPDSASPPATTSPRGAPGGAMENRSSSPSGATTGAAGKPATPPQSLVGQDVVNAEGDDIGEVKAIQGNKVLISVGGFLGIGEKNVSVDWDQLQMTGTGKDAKLRTSMTKDQLKSLPAADEASTRGGATGTTRTPATR